MENNKIEQMEALKAVVEYNEKLLPALQEVVKELQGAPKEDTKEYLDYILKGVNWVIQVVNGTTSLLSEQGKQIKKEEINEFIQKINQSIKQENNIETANVIVEGILPFVVRVTEDARQVVGQ